MTERDDSALYRYCPRCAAALESRLLKAGEPARLVCSRCAFVFYLDPKIAVGTIIRTTSDRIVLVRIDGLVNIYSYAGRAPVIVVYAATAVGGTLQHDDECLETAEFVVASIPWDHLAFQSTRDGLRDYLAGLLHPVAT